MLVAEREVDKLGFAKPSCKEKEHELDTCDSVARLLLWII
jgi:hypothetical protein